MSRIIVIGSINMDIVMQVEEHAKPGETVHALATEYTPGGKGANQAVAANLSGSDTYIIGAVGEDEFGTTLLNTLILSGVNTSKTIVKEGTSGMALITVNAKGENNITLSPGANHQLSSHDIPLDDLLEGDIVMLQNEIPWDITQYIIRKCHKLNITTYLNPAPAINIPSNILPLIDTLFLNETETEYITHIDPTDFTLAREAAQKLLNQGVKNVIITLGAKGSLFMSKETDIHTPAYSVKPVDTTSAGDTFIGAYAACQSRSLTVQTSLQYATAASAICITREGAQKSIPTKTEIEDFMKTRSVSPKGSVHCSC